MYQVARHEDTYIVFDTVTKKTIARFNTELEAILFIKNKP